MRCFGMLRLCLVLLIFIYCVYADTASEYGEYASWIEILNHGHGCYVEALPLYEDRGFITITPDIAKNHHHLDSIHIYSAASCLDASCGRQFTIENPLPLCRYFELIRLHYANDLELPKLWEMVDNEEGLLRCDVIVSLRNELQTLQLINVRVGELRGDLLHPLADGNYDTAEYVADALRAFVAIAGRVVERLLEMSFSGFAAGVGVETSLISDSAFTNRLQEYIWLELVSSESVDTMSEAAKSLMNVYLHRSLLPYVMLQWWEEERLYSEDSSKRHLMVLNDQDFQYHDHADAAMTRLIIVRHENDKRIESKIADQDSFAALSAAKVKKMMFSVGISKNITHLINSAFGYSAHSIRTFVCLRLTDAPTSNSYTGTGVPTLSSSLNETILSEPGGELCFVDDSFRCDYPRAMTIPALALAGRFLQPNPECDAKSSAWHKSTLTNSLLGILWQGSHSGATEEAVDALLDRESRLSFLFPNCIPNQVKRNCDESNTCDVEVEVDRQTSETVTGTFEQWAFPLWANTDFSNTVSGIYSSSHIKNDIPRALILGAGGGMMYSWLLQDFPHLIVDCVDISEDIIRGALDYFGLHRSVCGILKMHQQNGHVRFDSVNYTYFNDQVGIFNRNGSKYDTLTCRSHMIIADAWEYIEHMSNRVIASPTNSLMTYDLIMYDVADISHFDWDGTPGSGSHLSHTIVTKALNSFRNLITPHTGIGVFHISLDGLFDERLRDIINVFGKEQVVYLRLKSNCNIIVVSRDKYQSKSDPDVDKASHPCADPSEFAKVVERFAFSIHADRQAVYSYKYSLYCDEYWEDF